MNIIFLLSFFFLGVKVVGSPCTVQYFKACDHILRKHFMFESRKLCIYIARNSGLQSIRSVCQSFSFAVMKSDRKVIRMNTE